jgi:hypothetical protein
MAEKGRSTVQAPNFENGQTVLRTAIVCPKTNHEKINSLDWGGCYVKASINGVCDLAFVVCEG